MTCCYFLEHHHKADDGSVDDKLIGIYSSKEKAREALSQVHDQPGFRDRPEEFCLYTFVIDHTNWQDGQPNLPPESLGARDCESGAAPSTTVYSLWYELENTSGPDEYKFIGVYSTEQKAEEARVLVRGQAGFQNAPGDLNVYQERVDLTGWREGYVTLTPEGM